ncbi:MAG: hypothetical protein ABIK85_01815 [Candidatus Eisenbacteria bacterium]
MKAVGALLLVLPAAAQSLTPDVFDLKVARHMEAVQGTEESEAWIEAQLEFETGLLGSADLIALGLVVDVLDSQSIRPSAPYSSLAQLFREQRVRMTVETYLRGDCGDTLAFAEVGLPVSSSMARSPLETRYEPGERIVVLLRGACAGGGEFHSVGRGHKYVVEAGVVTRKGLELEKFLDELRSVLREELRL